MPPANSENTKKMLINLEDVKNKLQKSERSEKMLAFKQLAEYCEAENSIEELEKTFDECYLYILCCYSDHFENVREQAIEAITMYLKRLPPNDFHFLNVLATMKERLGKLEVVESCEELRYSLISQLDEIVDYYVELGNSATIIENMKDIVLLLEKGALDNFPTLQRKACNNVIKISRIMSGHDFSEYAGKLVGPISTLLNHKHSITRMNAIEALGRLALHVNPSGETLTRLLNSVSPLLMDHLPIVRRACGVMGGLLMLELRDRYSYFERLLPLVLCCLKDDSSEVVNEVRPLWVKCGFQYYNENEAELSKQELIDIVPKNYPYGIRRPTIGCRAIVQRSLRLLQLIVREMQDWKDNVRFHSLKLLYVFVLHTETAMTAKFFEIYGDLANACSDNEINISNEALKVADLMGRLLKYEDWREHAITGLQKNPKIGHVKCFYYLFTPTFDVNIKDLILVSNILVTKEFSQNLKTEFQLEVIKLVKTLLDKAEDLRKTDYLTDSREDLLVLDESAKCSLDKNAYIIVVKIMALSIDVDHLDCDKLRSKCNECLEIIAKRELTKVPQLHDLYQLDALAYVEDLDVPLEENSEPILLLGGLIRTASFGPSYVEKMKDLICLVFEHCLDNAKLKIFSAISISILKWGQNFENNEDNLLLLRGFLDVVVVDHLQWRAGATAEGMRTFAIATLSALAQDHPYLGELIFSDYKNYYVNLLEDNSVATRRYALNCVFYLVELDVNDLKPIAYAILQRMDDPSAAIRELAVAAISKIQPKFTKESGDAKQLEIATWNLFIETAIDKMMLHYDGPDLKIKGQIRVSLSKLSSMYPAISKESFLRTRALLCNSAAIQELESYLTLN